MRSNNTSRAKSNSRSLKTDPAAPLLEAHRRFPPSVRALARRGQVSIYHAAAIAALWGLPTEEVA
jgi:hypothetical protein